MLACATSKATLPQLSGNPWSSLFTEAPPPLPLTKRLLQASTFLRFALSGRVSFLSRLIDHASKFGVDFVVQPGGSVGDESVKVACEEYGMAMIHTGVRLFHH